MSGSRPIRVFLVDHRCHLWGWEKLIQSSETAMEVVGSTTGFAEVLALVIKAAPDVILIDMDLDGDSALAAIPQIVARSPARIVVLTGLRDESVHDRAVLAGAHGIVKKDASAETILTAIAKVHDGQLWLDRAAIGRVFVEFARQSTVHADDPEQHKISTLTNRERNIIAVIANHTGATAQVIANNLYISEHTLRNHLTSIYGKLGLANRLELFAYAREHGLDKLSN